MMVARYTGAALGLFAFGLATLSGLIVGNPAEVILSRALWALVVFCVIGLTVGAAAQMVIGEYEVQQLAASLPQESDGAADLDDDIQVAQAAGDLAAGGSAASDLDVPEG
ncbi:MAG: hypothetical protein GXP29_12925 [Planctomycetes bacterium]|nr:hypothetical protein [Planctomycetota bacterium]